MKYVSNFTYHLVIRSLFQIVCIMYCRVKPRYTAPIDITPANLVSDFLFVLLLPHFLLVCFYFFSRPQIFRVRNMTVDQDLTEQFNNDWFAERMRCTDVEITRFRTDAQSLRSSSRSLLTIPSTTSRWPCIYGIGLKVWNIFADDIMVSPNVSIL